MGVPAAEVSLRALFVTAEDARAARGPAGAEMGRIFYFLLPRRRFRFRASRGLGAPKSFFCAGLVDGWCGIDPQRSRRAVRGPNLR